MTPVVGGGHEERRSPVSQDGSDIRPGYWVRLAPAREVADVAHWRYWAKVQNVLRGQDSRWRLSVMMMASVPKEDDPDRINWFERGYRRQVGPNRVDLVKTDKP